MENQIRGAVFSKFNSIISFADAIGWHRNKASRIVNGKQSPSAEDMQQMVKCLNIDDASAFVAIFFPDTFTK